MKKFFKWFSKIDSTSIYPLFFTIVFLSIIFQYRFPGLESVFYDSRIRSDLGIRDRGDIVLVGLDEESEEFLGDQYPFVLNGHNRFLRRLIDDRPEAIVYLVDFSAPSNERENQQFKKLKNLIEDYINRGGIFRFGTSMDQEGERLPPEGLRDLGFSLALLNVDNMVFARDDVVRRAILNISGEESLHLWLANQIRNRRGETQLGINDIKGAYYLRDADANFTLFRYPYSPREDNYNLPLISFHRAQVGNFPAGFFSDKIVLVGPNYISNLNDFVLTPFNSDSYVASKLAVHGAIIQSLVQNKTVTPVPLWVSLLLSTIIAITLSILISRLRPSRGLILTVWLLMGLFIIAYALFTFFGLWLYMSHILLTILIVYYIWVPFRAIGEYQRRYAIQEEAKLLKKVENLKQNFISLMSHDLKTPVAKIAGVADVMKQKYFDRAEVRKDILLVEDATKELNGFINSILDLTKIESEDMALTKSPKDLNKIVESVSAKLSYEANRKKIEIECELGPLYPIEIDPNLMTRVISNILENAIKYSHEGSTIKIKSYDDESWVTLEIGDNGPGIPEKDIEHIFDRFYRVKNDSSHKIKGTGLGLYLVKYFVELHGGLISVESKVGQGTVFTVKLPNK